MMGYQEERLCGFVAFKLQYAAQFLRPPKGANKVALLPLYWLNAKLPANTI